MLILDDSRTAREVLKVYLMGGAYEFVEAESAEEALAEIDSARVDLVVADVNLPSTNGFDFTRQVRLREPARVRRVPIMLISSDKSPSLHDRGIAAGADLVLKKPVESGQFVEAVERLLERLPQSGP